MKYSMEQREQPLQLRECGDEASADTHESYADEHVAHKTAMTLTDKATFQPEAEDKVRMLNAACRMTFDDNKLLPSIADHRDKVM